jgi:hypothetical protein
MEHQLPVAVVCRVLGAPRSSIYARRAQADTRGRPGPATSISDPDVVELIRQVLVASPFAGEGYRKVRAQVTTTISMKLLKRRVSTVSQATGSNPSAVQMAFRRPIWGSPAGRAS